MGWNAINGFECKWKENLFDMIMMRNQFETILSLTYFFWICPFEMDDENHFQTILSLWYMIFCMTFSFWDVEVLILLIDTILFDFSAQ
jgi:hypothetical protein